MPQFVSPFTIKDGSATPADVTYSPELLSSGSTILVDRREAARDMQPAIAITFERPVPQRPSYKQVVEVTIPLVRMVNGVAVPQRPLKAQLKFDLASISTQQERKHLQAAVVNASNQALLKAGAVDLDPLY